MKLELSISEEKIKDLIHSILVENALLHWCELRRIENTTNVDELYIDLTSDGLELLTLTENDDESTLLLTLEKLKSGLEKMWMDGELCETVIEFISEDELDPDVVDCIVQVSLLGEFKYNNEN